MSNARVYPEALNYVIPSLDREIAEIQQMRRKLILEITDRCSHLKQDLREMPYNSGGFVGRPWCICMNCGYTEEGWGCGYKKLKHAPSELPTISRAAWCEKSTRRVFQDGAEVVT